MKEDAPLLNASENNSSTHTNKILVWSLVVINAIIFGASILFVIQSRQAAKLHQTAPQSPLDYRAQQFADALPESLLPTKYLVDEMYINPPTDQHRRGTCWDFSTLYCLESQYRAQGIKQGYLKSDEYVTFSQQGYGAFLGNYCRAHPDVKPCKYGGFLKGTTNDNQVESLLYFQKILPEITKSVVPESVCPYFPQKSNITDFVCDNLDDALKINPIEFKIKEMRMAYDIRGSKQLLFDVQRPVSIGTALASILYYTECEGSEFENDPVCTEKQIPCPDGLNDKFCYTQKFSGKATDGAFLAVDGIHRIVERGGHAMNIVGYNDEWTYENRLATPQSAKPVKGGFILHNSWGIDGHSVEFLMGQRTLENEAVVCPNHNAATSWIPATFECISENQTDITQCSRDIQRIRGKGLTNGPDLLDCLKDGKYCKEGKSYILERKENEVFATPLDNGLYEVHLIEVDNVTLGNPTRVTWKLPFWFIPRYLTPRNLVKNNPQHCGFYMMPYQTLEMMKRRNWDFFDNFRVADIEVEFLPKSYARSKEFKEDKTISDKYLKQSTFTKADPGLDGPVPFEIIY